MLLLHVAEPLKESHKSNEQPEVFSAEQLYDKYAPLLFSIITKIIPDNKKAEDTLVEVFLHLHKHLSDYNPAHNPFSIWLMNNARNIAIDNLCTMQENFTDNSNVKTLTLAEKTVFALHYFRSLSISEISEVLHVSTPLVEKLLHSAEVKTK